MLVLSRKQDQEIIIGDGIKITILKIKGNTIRLGIEAPRDVKVIRGELPVRQHDNQASPTSSTPAAPETTANVTVVFSNSSPEKQPKLDVIPFRKVDFENAKQRQSQLDSQRAADDRAKQESSSSIRFRQQLPKSLEHNRLKELVKKLTGNN